MKKYLKLTLIVLFSFIIILLALPLFFKGKIITLVKGEINKTFTAKVDFDDLDISWFKHFPRLTVSLENISIAGTGVFEGDTLLHAESFDAAVNILSVLKGSDMKVYGVFLHSPRIHAKINEDGKANWEITKEDSTQINSTETSPFNLSIEKYSIKDGNILYEDEAAGMRAELTGLNHSGSGNFNEKLFTLKTSTKASSANFRYANIPYLVDAETGIDADIEINSASSKYSFKNANLVVNNLKLLANGFFQLVDDSTYNMDINFDAPSNDFKNILSLIPAIYAKDFNDIKTSGEAAFKGFVKGTYSNQSIPGFDVTLEVKNGFFQYPDLPKPVKNVQVSARFTNPDGVPDNTVVDIKKAHLQFGDHPFDFSLLFKHPETAKYIDLIVKGKLDLGEISNYVKLDAGTKLAGLIDADAFVKGNFSAIENKNGPFAAGGFFIIRNFHYASKDLPFPINNGNFDVKVNNQGGVADATSIDVRNGRIEMGKDVIDFNFAVTQPVSTIAFNGDIKGSFSLDKVQQFTTLEPGTFISGLVRGDMKFSGSKAFIDKGQYDKISFSGNSDLNNIVYKSKDYPDGVHIQSASLVFNTGNVILKHLNGVFQNTKFSASGALNNMIAYALDKGALKGEINVSADKVQLNEWMGDDTTNATTASSSAPMLVPGNVDIVVNTKVDAVVYDKVTYKNVSGKLKLADETVHLQNVNAEALDGQMNFDGSYSTKTDKKQPAINLNYSVKDIDVQKAFFAYNTMQKLMPIGQFLAGKMNSQFIMHGKLGADLFPQLSSLSGKGDLLLIQGVLGKFKPLEKIASVLQVDALKEVTLKDIKTHFEFANGKVLVKPFALKVKDIDMLIGGTHGLDQSMDYLVAMKIPRHYLGEAGNALVNNITTAALKKGIPIQSSEIVNLNLRMTGAMNNPSVKTDLKEASGDMTKELKDQAASFVQHKADSTKQAVRDTLSQAKKQVIEDVKKDVLTQLTGSKDSTGKKVSFDSTKKRTEEKIKGTLNSLFNKKKKTEN